MPFNDPRSGKIRTNKKVSMDVVQLTFDQVKDLAKNNNHSQFSDELVIGICWAESTFRPDNKAAPPATSAGLMGMNHGAIDTVNDNTPSQIHFQYADMFIPASAISCGSWYLKILAKQYQGDARKTLRKYRGVTDYVYADKIIACEKCLQTGPSNRKASDCLGLIHP